MNVELDSLSPERVYDVAIVGAGPVGLATAIALSKRGIDNILAIDRTRSFRRVGQIIDILPNGLKALKYIDERAYKQVQQTALGLLLSSRNNNSEAKSTEIKEKTSSQKGAWHHKNFKGEVIQSIPLDSDYWFHRYGEGRVSIAWYDLQTSLRNLLPSSVVRANHRCVDITERKGYLEVACISDRAIDSNPFAHWEIQHSEQDKIVLEDELENRDYNRQKFRAKLVVAADGINSTVRQVLYANSNLSQWAKPQYSGVAAIGCLHIDNVPDEIIKELEASYFQGDRVITLRDDSRKSIPQKLEAPRIIIIRRQEKTFGYLLHTPLSLDLLQNKSTKEIIHLAVEILEKANFPANVANLVSLSTPDGLFHRPYYLHPVDIPIDSQPLWSRGRLVLVGDAAHGMPPFAAQGVNQGFEDAALVSALIANIVANNALDNEQIIANEFSKYEQIRRPFLSKIQSATMENHSWSQAEWDKYCDMVYCRDLEQLINNIISQK